MTARKSNRDQETKNSSTLGVGEARAFAEDCLKNEKFDEAKRAYEYIILQEPTCHETMEALADLFQYEFGDFKEAQKYYEKAILLSPENGAEKYMNYAELLCQVPSTTPMRKQRGSQPQRTPEALFQKGIDLCEKLAKDLNTESRDSAVEEARKAVQGVVALIEYFLSKWEKNDAAIGLKQKIPTQQHGVKITNLLEYAERLAETYECSRTEIARLSALYWGLCATPSDSALENCRHHSLIFLKHLPETMDIERPSFGTIFEFVRDILLGRLNMYEEAWNTTLDLNLEDELNIDVYELLALIRLRAGCPVHAIDIIKYSKQMLEESSDEQGSDCYVIDEATKELKKRGLTYDWETNVELNPLECLRES